MSHDLYREILIDHYSHPRHTTVLASPTHQGDTANRSCGDRVQIQLTVVNDVIEQVGIQTEGCALAVAGGSVLAEQLFGKKLSDVKTIDEQRIFQSLGGITPGPARARCATLALEALRSVLRT